MFHLPSTATYAISPSFIDHLYFYLVMDRGWNSQNNTVSNGNTVLLLAYYYPPYAGVSGQRTEKFCKYLPEFGWRPIVFTVDERYYGNRTVQTETTSIVGKSREAEVKRVRYVRIPGATVIMKLIHPLLALGFIIRNRRMLDVVYMSGSPFHPFLMTSLITGLLRIPTVLDFRDSWSINHGYDGAIADTLFSRAREKTFKFIERIAIRFASHVVFATTCIQSEYEELHPYWSSKFSTIPNGFDPDEVAAVTPNRQFAGTTLILAGKFHIYTPEAVDALMQTLQSMPDINFVYVGEEHSIIETAANRHNVDAQVVSFPFKPKRDVLELIAGADIGLLSTGMVNGLGTKIFEYLVLGKPAVCLVPGESVIASEFRSTCSVVVTHPPHTPERIDEVLQRSLLLVGQPQTIDLTAFNRRETASKLTQLLKNVSG